MTNKQIKQASKLALKKDRWMPVLVTFVYSLIVMYVPIFLTGTLSIGVFNYYTKSLNGEKKSFEDLFSGFKLFGKSLGTLLLILLYTFLWSLIPFAGPFISYVKNYSYSLSLLLLKDNPEMSANEAITKSRELMDGKKWQRFCLDFSFIGWHILDMFTCGLLGILYVVPYKQFSVIKFYEELKK